MNTSFWKEKKVFLTGHTGFKGSWLSICLLEMGAEIIGYSNQIPTNPSLFEAAGLEQKVQHIVGDVRDYNHLFTAIRKSSPDVLIHMAAQPLVRISYKKPRETCETNIMGTVNVVEAVRHMPQLKSTVIVTTDKCYENREWVWGYREKDPMGGHDPYSGSKGASELIVSSYNHSFFCQSGKVVCSARAGNVIGGGDWAEDRLVPDIVKSLLANEKVLLRNPKAIRPWQHVLEPLSGYLLLAENGYKGYPVYGGWNFGPKDEDAQNVQWVTELVGQIFGKENIWEKDGNEHPHEANYLKLDTSKARINLRWTPRWNAEEAVKRTIYWYKFYYEQQKKNTQEIYKRCLYDLYAYRKKEQDDYRKKHQTKVQESYTRVLSDEVA